MAENKKSVLLYCDLIHTVEKMTDEQSGKFFKHYLRYINDLNPKTDDQIVDLVFESVKQNLKRDLRKWEEKKDKKSNSGSLGNLKRWHKDLYKDVIEERKTLLEAQKIAKDRTAIKSIANIAVNVTDTVTVTDTVIKKHTIDCDEVLDKLSSPIRKEVVQVWYKHGFKPSADTVATLDGWFDALFEKHNLKAKDLSFIRRKLFEFDTWASTKRPKNHKMSFNNFLTKKSWEQ